MRLVNTTFVGILGVLGLLGACAGDDAAGAPVSCTKQLYDSCREEHDCDTANCKPFNGDGITVCTQTCTPGDNATCPPQGGVEVECNTMGICKPPMANACDLQP